MPGFQAAGLIFRRRMSISGLSPENEPRHLEAGQKIGSFFTTFIFYLRWSIQWPTKMIQIIESILRGWHLKKNTDTWKDDPIFCPVSKRRGSFFGDECRFLVCRSKMRLTVWKPVKKSGRFLRTHFDLSFCGLLIIKVSGPGSIVSVYNLLSTIVFVFLWYFCSKMTLFEPENCEKIDTPRGVLKN